MDMDMDEHDHASNSESPSCHRSVGRSIQAQKRLLRVYQYEGDSEGPVLPSEVVDPWISVDP